MHKVYSLPVVDRVRSVAANHQPASVAGQATVSAPGQRYGLNNLLATVAVAELGYFV